MAKFKVLITAVNRIVDGGFVSHRMHEIVELSKEEAARLLRLKAVAPVDADGNVTEMPDPDPQSPHLEPDLEDGQDTTVGRHAAPEPAAAPRGNAPLEEWVAYAKSKGATDEDLAGLGQRQIREKYAPATE